MPGSGVAFNNRYGTEVLAVTCVGCRASRKADSGNSHIRTCYGFNLKARLGELHTAWEFLHLSLSRVFMQNGEASNHGVRLRPVTDRKASHEAGAI